MSKILHTQVYTLCFWCKDKGLLNLDSMVTKYECRYLSLSFILQNLFSVNQYHTKKTKLIFLCLIWMGMAIFRFNFHWNNYESDVDVMLTMGICTKQICSLTYVQMFTGWGIIVASHCFIHEIFFNRKKCCFRSLDTIWIILLAALSSSSNMRVSNTTGSPGSPRDMSITKTSTTLTIHWSEGITGAAPVNGYVIESRSSGKLEHIQLFIYSHQSLSETLDIALQ